MTVVLQIDPVAPQRDVLDRAALVLAAGGVVAYPTETFYGLGADPRSEDAVARVFDLKGRTSAEALPLVAFDRATLEAHVGPLPPLARRLADVFWPGPLTLVVPLARVVLADALTAGRVSVAVRVPAHPVARALARACGGLLTSTSANRSGAPPATTAGDVPRARGLDLILDGGPTAGGAPSTIVDVTGADPRLVRAGQVSFDRVLESLQ